VTAPVAREARRLVRVADPEGLHARPCAAIAKTAAKFKSRAVVVHDGHEADARSVLELMTLAVLSSTDIQLRATGEDAEACVAALAAVVASR
jgi:phosphocarrier protein